MQPPCILPLPRDRGASVFATARDVKEKSREAPARTGALSASLSAVLLSSLFTLSGTGTALLGATMPALLVHWRLSDRAGGELFFLSWLGAALGALLSRGSLPVSVLRGVVLTVFASCGLAMAGRVALFPFALCYGLGLGIVMTSISRLRAERSGARGTGEMNRLNLLWAVGALVCPPLAAHALVTSRAAYLLFAQAAVFAGVGLAVAATEQRLPVPAARPTPGTARLPAAPLLFSCFAVLAVGVEAALGAWLTTYARRADGSVAGAVSASSAFWAGLLLSRAVHATRVSSRLHPVAVLRWHSCLVAGGLLLLMGTLNAWGLVALAGTLGFGLGPLYPALLAVVVARHRGNRVFCAAGLGSAAIPWLTGVVSSAAGSLHTGLAVPCAAGCLLAALATGALGGWGKPAA